MKKSRVVEAVLLAVGGVAVAWVASTVQPMITADMAVAQLEDSDLSYNSFQASKYVAYTLQFVWGCWAGSFIYRLAFKSKGDK